MGDGYSACNIHIVCLVALNVGSPSRRCLFRLAVCHLSFLNLRKNQSCQSTQSAPEHHQGELHDQLLQRDWPNQVPRGSKCWVFFSAGDGSFCALNCLVQKGPVVESVDTRTRGLYTCIGDCKRKERRIRKL